MTDNDILILALVGVATYVIVNTVQTGVGDVNTATNTITAPVAAVGAVGLTWLTFFL